MAAFTLSPQNETLNAGYWEVREAVILLLGAVPEIDDSEEGRWISATLRPGDQDRLKKICEYAYRDIDAGVLPYVGKRKHRLVRPADFCRWAIGKGYAVPSEWVAAWMNDAGDIQASDSASNPDEPVADLVSPLPDSTIVESLATAARKPSKKQEQRIEAIRCAIAELGFNVSNPPYGGIKQLKNMLGDSHPDLFTPKSFNKNCAFDRALKALRESEERKKPER